MLFIDLIELTNFIKEKFPKGYYSNHNLSEYKKHRVAIFAQVLFICQLQSKILTSNDFIIKVGEDFLNLKVTQSKFEKERFYGTFKIEKKELMDLLDNNYKFDLPDGVLEDDFNQIWNRLEQAKKEGSLDEDDKLLKDDDLKKRYKNLLFLINR